MAAGLESNGIDLRVFQTASLDCGGLSAVPAGQGLDVGNLVEALDTDGIRITEVVVGGSVQKHRPYVQWNTGGPIDGTGRLTTMTEGEVQVTGKAGDLAAFSCTVRVGPAATPTPAPSPSPSPDPLGPTVLATTSGTIIRMVLAPPYLYAAENRTGEGAVVRIPAQGGQAVSLASKLTNPVGKAGSNLIDLAVTDRWIFVLDSGFSIGNVKTGGIVRKLSLVGGAVEYVASELNYPRYLRADDRYFFVGEWLPSAVLRYSVDGGGRTVLVSGDAGIGQISGMAQDGDSIYFSDGDGSSGAVRRLAKSGGPVETLVSGLSCNAGVLGFFGGSVDFGYCGPEYTFGVGLQAPGEWGADTLVSGRREVITSVLVAADSVYFVEGLGKIFRKDRAGGEVTPVATSSGSIWSLAGDDSYLYWSDADNGHIPGSKVWRLRR